MNFSDRSKSLIGSPIRKYSDRVAELREEGVDVIPLNIGQPDIPTPHDFLEAVRCYDVDVLAYQNSRGMKRTLETMQLYLHNYGLDFDLKEMCITNGASEALNFSMCITCNPGDYILTIEPFYTAYNSIAKSQGVNILPVTSHAADGFRIPPLEYFDKVIEESGVKNRLRALLLSSPSNPTGRVYDLEEMETLVELVDKYDLWLIADEVYREFNYTSRPFHSFAEFEKIRDKVILVDSISKKYSACGARIGSLTSKNKEFNDKALKMCQTRLCVSTLDQIGAGAMDVVDDQYVEDNRKTYRERRDALQERLSRLEGVIAPKPEGAFYIVIQLPLDDADDFVNWTLENVRVNNKTVLMTPAESFYATPGLGKNEVRLSYCLDVHRLMEAMDILEIAIKTYPKMKK